MDTDSTWFAVLVIILSVFLALFLALSIVLVVKAIQITNKIKYIVQQAEQVADRAESVSAFFEKTNAPFTILKLIANIGETVQKKARRK